MKEAIKYLKRETRKEITLLANSKDNFTALLVIYSYCKQLNKKGKK